MSSSDGSNFSFQIQRIADSEIKPTDRIDAAANRRLTVAKRTIDQNYHRLDEYIDGDLQTNPIFLCQSQNRQNEGFEVLRLLHNYLSSLYSLNETIRILVNQHTSDAVDIQHGEFTGNNRDTPYYGRRLTFLRGLRTDFQHGGFSCLEFDEQGSLGDFAGYHVIFDRGEFLDKSGLRDPQRFLRHTSQTSRRYPICYVGGFHQNTVQDFFEDTRDWFDLG